MVVMYVMSCRGQPLTNICSPVGSGKSSAAKAFIQLHSLYFEYGSFLIVKSQNAQCNELAVNMFDDVSEGSLNCQVIRLCSGTEHYKKQRRSRHSGEEDFQKEE